MRYYKSTTKAGLSLLETAARCKGYQLSDLYKTWSRAKEVAFEQCLAMYIESTDSYDFRVGNANTFGFTATWCCTVNGKPAQRIETKSNSYCVFYET